MADIRVSPERLRSTASQLESSQQQVDQLLRDMINTVNSLQGEWTGLAQVDYAQLFNDQVPKTQTNLAEILTRLISELRRIAQTFEDTDANVI